MDASFILLILTSALVAQTPLQPIDPAQASIEGHVLKSGSTDPLQGVTVTATPETGAAKKSTSDAEGNFAIRDLAAGRYMLSIAKTGYAKPRRGAGPANISVIAGQSITGVKLQMAATAVITGRVLDENDNPLNGKTVYVVAPHYDMGRRILNPNPSSSAGLSARTDERGEYRLYGIEPGEYYVVTSGDRGLNRFYPRASDPADAIPLVLAPGSETGGIDIHISSIPLYVIRMKSATPIDGIIGISVTGSVSRSYSPSSSLQVNRRSRDGWDIRNVVPYGIGFGRSNDGIIESPGLPPGSYDLFIGGATFNSGSSHIAFDITNHDLDLGTLTAQRLTPLVGRVQPIAGVNFDAIRVTLTPLDGYDRLASWANNTVARIAADGTFRFTGTLLLSSVMDANGSVGDGIYQVGLSGLPANMYVASALYAGRDTLDTGLHIEGNPSSPLEITIGVGGTVHGVVEKGNDTVQDSLVFLIPSANHRGNLNLYKTASTDQDGTFTIRGVAPGDYGILAWEDMEPNAWLNADFLKRFESQTQHLTLIGAASLEVNVRVIPDSK
jgi:protocatechuate 3,4-dioxygenase beta subunit